MGMKTVERDISPEGTPLYDFAESLLETGFDAYDYAKCVWLGSSDPEARLAGDHPWPTREYDGETFVYSTPIHAGFNAVRGTALFIGKDPWRDEHDPRSWLVAEANLKTGEEKDHLILSASVDAARQLWLQLAPSNYSNIPRWGDRYDENGWKVSSAGTAYNPPRYDQIRAEGTLREDYYLEEATLRYGLRSHYVFEDIVVLESMTHLAQEVRDAQNISELEMRRRQALEYEAGRRAVLRSHHLAA